MKGWTVFLHGCVFFHVSGSFSAFLTSIPFSSLDDRSMNRFTNIMA